MREDSLLSGLRAVARELDDAAPPIGPAEALLPPAGSLGPDRRPLLALVAAFVLVAGLAAWLLVTRPAGDDDSVVTPGPIESTTSTAAAGAPTRTIEGPGLAVGDGVGPWSLYSQDGELVGTADGPEYPDQSMTGALELSTVNGRLMLPTTVVEVPDGCSFAMLSRDVRVAACGLVDGYLYRELHVIGVDGSARLLTGAPVDPAEPPNPDPILGQWTRAMPSPDGRWVLAEWSAECGSSHALLLPSDGSGELRTVTGESGTDGAWIYGVQTHALGWTVDGRAIYAVPASDCGGPLPDPGVYVADPATAERELLRAGTEPFAYLFESIDTETPISQLLLDAVVAAGAVPCCPPLDFDPAIATQGVEFEGANVLVRGGVAGTETFMPTTEGQVMPFLHGEALISNDQVFVNCGPNTWVASRLDSTQPEVDSMFLLLEQLVPHLGCTLRAPPTAGG